MYSFVSIVCAGALRSEWVDVVSRIWSAALILTRSVVAYRDVIGEDHPRDPSTPAARLLPQHAFIVELGRDDKQETVSTSVDATARPSLRLTARHRLRDGLDRLDYERPPAPS